MTSSPDDAAIEELIRARIQSSVDVKMALARDLDEVVRIAHVLVEGFRGGHSLMLFGNGGSAADAQHIAAEFVGRFYIDRQPLPAIALTTNTSVLTAIGNDFGYDHVFERQVQAAGRAGDIAVGISTSGNAESVLRAVRMARSLGLTTIGLSGRTGGRLAGEVDHLVTIPSDDTPRIQEAHILLGHIWSEIVEQALFGAPPS